MRSLCALVAVIAVVGVACSSSNSVSAGSVTKVVATDTVCKPAKTEFAAGKQTFEVHNEGTTPTEMYVYGHKGKFIGEVENIDPGNSRPLTVDVKAGEFQLACKPGQSGDGIRTAIKVSGKGGAESAGSATADRDVQVVASEYKFIGLENFSAKTGESDNFELINNGKEKHELEIRGPDGKTLGEVEPVDPGKNDEAVFKFSSPGTYTYVCGLKDHEARGMKGVFTVS